MLRLITDFDGPIMDVSERYYQVYQFCLDRVREPQQPVKVLSKSDFWQLKRSRTPERQIGILSGLGEEQSRIFAQMRGQTVHTEPYLHHDTPVEGAVAALEKARQEGLELVVMTMRRTRELEEACRRCQIGRFFPEERRYCLSNDYVKTGDINDKPLLMERALAELPAADDVWMVGDTEADMVAATSHGVKAIGVLSGIRDRPRLEIYEPDLIVNNLAEAVDFILTESKQLAAS
ncbi:MAG: HAD family hydrolase [Geitlerinemataceae cyanobacterium]